MHQKSVIPGAYQQLKGLKHIDKLIKIDQSPIGRTPRSNPATYTKMMLPIRELFSQTLEAKRRGYTKSRFSFNVSGERGGGRCSECEGAGFKTIDMQFLSNVTLPCESCNGNRFNHETLEIRYKGKNIFDVLEMTILEASVFFANQKKIHRTLQLLVDVGLGYVKLGQPSTTLSGGEAQRIKLASELQNKSTGKTLYVLDEPTTGLHMADVARLLEAIQKLVHAGNTIVVIEHDLDLIQAADHIVDLGPKGGLEGGNIVGVGTPEEIARLDTPTGRALQKSLIQQHKPAKTKTKPRSKNIVIKGASLHNLKNVDVSIPQQSLSIITGPSGSGKTSLAFDTLFAEGQRRYVESLSTYARRFLGRMQRPPLRESSGLAPAIAIDQRNKGHTPRSTVATATEIYDLFRLLYARIGKPHCPHCQTPMQAYSPSKAARHLKENAPHAGWLTSLLEGDILAGELMQSGYLRCWDNDSERELQDPKELLHNPQIIIDRLNPARSSLVRLSDGVQKGYGIGRNQILFQTKKSGLKFSYARDMRCSIHGKMLPEKITPRHFSFNTILGACPRCNGLGRVKEIDLQKLFPKPKKPIWNAIHGWVRASFHSSPKIRALIKALFKAHGLSMSLAFENWPPAFLNELMHGHPHPLPITYKRGARKYKDTVAFEGLNKMINAWSNDATWLRKEGVCPDCNGQRLKKEISAIKIQGKNISELCELRIGEALSFWQSLSLTESEQKIAAQVSKELIARLQFLTDVGLSYLQLNRGAKTLSGGESQRIRLASQLGSGLSRSIYVLDEPTIGLHHSDTQKLIHTLKQLRELDNTIVIVEHDESVIRSADYVIDMGPAAGAYGGQIVESGPPQGLQKGLTGQYLRGAASIPLRAKTRRPQKWIPMPQTDKHNLKSVSPKLPRGLLTAVTGVSGSGKSTLIMEEFAALLEAKCSKKSRSGVQSYQVVTQRPIGKSPRSTPVSYCDIWDPIRELFSSTKEAQSRGWKKRRFSYNTPDGRCVHCEGRGATLVEMHFLSDIWLPCEHCNGTRFNAQTLEIKWSGLSISDVLNLSVSEALQFFQNHKRIYRRLQALSDIGLGYLRLGQPANELSGGEAQRMKIAKFLAKGSRAKETCFLLDEPTTGLHFSDIAKLIKALHALVDAGHMVVLIEHNLDVISRADYILDMGPEGGEKGGRILDVGTPAEIAQRYAQTGSKTGKALYELQNQKTPSG
ncbi:MAG: excinuclease ABC subunit UvrA [Myxococcota bacterium]|nr:excinuclease ABC subunit UvrA [Myxococcota bacterium]